MIESYDKREYDNQYQVDQNFLKEMIYPSVKNRAMVHDEFFELKPFPVDAVKRTQSYFVGQVYDENEVAQFN